MDTHSDDERSILANGGPGALGELFSQHRDRLERIIAFRLDPGIRSRVDAADVLQEAYLEIARRLPEFLRAENVSFFVWIRGRTLQTLVDVHRRHFRERRDANREIRLHDRIGGQDTSLSIARFLIDELTSPSQAAVQAEEVRSLQEALNAMNETDREVLALRHFEQLTNNQVAEILGLSVTAASNRYLRAAARLGEILKHRSLGSISRGPRQ